nr:tetratricopeptide repeat protein [Altericroceibacterium endophyticum]
MLMREVDDAVRQDQFAGVAKRYGIIIIGAVVVLLAAFGGWLWWHEHREGQLEDRSETLVTALDNVDAGNLKAADETLSSIMDGDDTGAAAAAGMLRAGIAMEQGRSDDAIKLFDALAADDKAPQAYRDLALIRSTSAGFDKMKPQVVVDRLKPLAEPGNPWFASAGELVAMAYLKQGKDDLAGPLFAQIAKSNDAPESLRSRSRQIAGLLGYDAVEDVDETLERLREEGGTAAAPAQAAAAQ